jgi:hypothetical protein
VAPIQAERVFEIVEPFPSRLVAAVHQPAPSLKQYSRAEESIRVPPMARAARRAAEAEDAFPVTVETCAALGATEAALFPAPRSSTSATVQSGCTARRHASSRERGP